MLTVSRTIKAVCAVLAACCSLAFSNPALAQPGTGACCLPSGVCVTLDQCNCEMQGGGFGGVATSCVGFNCQVFRFGACCTITGCATTTFSLCALFPGTFTPGATCGGAGAPCPSSPIACCCANACYLTDLTLCNHQGGTSTSATSCSPNPCAGACCDAAGNCTLSQPAVCTGTYIGGSCTPNPCPPQVCCDPVSGACQTIVPCPSNWTPVLGPCTPTLCPVPQFGGVCCDVLGNCVQWVAGTPCNGQIFTNTTSCQPNPCRPQVCCDPATGVCQTIVPCPAGWLPKPGPCTPNNPCPPNYGVCCDLQNNCFPMVVGAQCNGTILPNQTSCTPNPCPQVVCCDAAGNCGLVASITACNGTVLPNLSSCNPNPCNPIVCCDPATGACQPLTVTPCPPGWIQIPGPCTPIPCVPQGICCDLQGNCFPLNTGVVCNGTVFPNISSCQPNPCIPNGACCQPCTGACQITTPNNCPSPNTYFPGASCSPGVCPTTPVFGNCCLNRNCIQATSCDCVLKGGTWTGGQPCSPALCAGDGPGACCHNNMCTVLSAGTCQQIGGISSIGQSCTAAFPPPQCNTTPMSLCCCCGLCHLIDAVACRLAGGIVLTGTACTPLSCFGGACCNPPTGACNMVSGPNACPAPLVYFSGAACTPNNPCIPSGACCDICTGTCTVTGPSACAGPLQNYTPGGTCLPPFVCVPTCGACCTVNAAGQNVCTIVSSQTVCTGNWQGVGSTCASVNNCNPPIVICCDLSTSACQSFGGNVCPTGWFQPAGATSCNPSPCPPFGACCQFGAITCTQTVQTACNGQWLANASCNPNPCVRLCCDNATAACSLVGFGISCPSNSTGFPGTSCSPNPCPPLGVCCVNGSILCTITFQNTCAGNWVSGGSCNPNPCILACCNPTTGACTQVFGGNICPIGFSPTFTGVACNPNPCPPVAPCCLQPNGCIVTTQNNCLTGPFPGIWGPVGGSCNIACSVACCNPATGACSVTGVFGVCPIGFTAIGNSACVPNVCPPVGRCCVFFGGCTVTTQANCFGSWGGPNTTCATTPCVHICCNTISGSCIVVPLYAYCFGGGYVNNFTLTSCSPNPCPPVLKPCCLPNGTCVLVSIAQCQNSGGAFFPTASCTPTFCRGACCLPPNVAAYGGITGTHCVLTTQAACNGNWHGYGSSCTTPPNTTNLTTCCPANVNHVNGLTFQDIFDFISAWFNGCTGQPGPPCNGVNADFNGDGFTTISDIFAFLTAFFAGCS